MKLNIGGGASKKEGYHNIDIYPFQNVDTVFDIEKGLPFSTESFDEVYSSHCLEHCSLPSIPNLLSEMFRVLTPGGKVTVIVPCLECSIQHFLEQPEEKRWGYPIEYIFGNQGITQIGQQIHKSGWTPKHSEKLFKDAGFIVDAITDNKNSLGIGCLGIYAHKPKENE
jgi:predicted SAM-dependent methyltransferase